MDAIPTPFPPSLTECFAGLVQFVSDRIGGRPDGMPAWERKPLPAALMMMQMLFRLGRLQQRLHALLAIARQKQAAPDSCRPMAPPCPPGNRRAPQAAGAPARLNWRADMFAHAPTSRAALNQPPSDTELDEPRLGRVPRPLAPVLGVRPEPVVIALHRSPRRPRPSGASSSRPSSRRLGKQRSGVMAMNYSAQLAALRAKPG